MFSFTIKATGILRDIVIEVGISDYFDPEKGETPPKTLDFMALWDTGATGCSISQRVVDALGLQPFGFGKVYHAGGVSEVETYNINLILPKKKVYIKGIQASLFASPPHFDMLIGMDVISQGDFAVTRHEGGTMVSFAIPSRGPIDFENNYFGANTSQSRNALCQCGSGKKYKSCHGK